MASMLRDLMTSNPTTLDVSATVSVAARAMRDLDVGDVLVMQNGDLRGIVTDRDIVVRCLAEGENPQSITVGELCTDALVTLSADASVADAVELMERHAIRRVPILENGSVLGIVSLGDLAVARAPRSALGQISAAPPSR